MLTGITDCDFFSRILFSDLKKGNLTEFQESGVSSPPKLLFK
jgi:hypothetical protein